MLACVSGEFLTEVDRNYHVIIYQTNSLIGRGPCHDAVLSNRRLFSKRVKSSIVNVYKCIGEKNSSFPGRSGLEYTHNNKYS